MRLQSTAQSLKLDRHNPGALAGAGLAAFELGRYDMAERYLQADVSADPSDAQSADRLKTAELVVQNGSIPATDSRSLSATGLLSRRLPQQASASNPAQLWEIRSPQVSSATSPTDSGRRLGEDEAADYGAGPAARSGLGRGGDESGV